MLRLIKRIFIIFSDNRIPQASAALSYYLTMTFFPMLIIAYCFLEGNYERAELLLVFGEKILSDDLIAFIRDYLIYIDTEDRGLMLPVGLSLLIAYASSGLRCVQTTIGAIQGGAEHKGVAAFISSFIYSFALLALSYFAMVVMIFGPTAFERLSLLLPGLKRIMDLLPFRYILLAGILFLFLLGLYHVPKRYQDKYCVLPGAAAASMSVLLMSPVFSFVMNRSIKYSLAYGALASFVLLMLWLYMCCLLVYSGAILNVALHEIKKL